MYNLSNPRATMYIGVRNQPHFVHSFINELERLLLSINQAGWLKACGHCQNHKAVWMCILLLEQLKTFQIWFSFVNQDIIIL